MSTLKASYPAPVVDAGQGLGPSAAPARWMDTAGRAFFRLRPEEAIALLFLVPTTYLTLAAQAFAREAGMVGAR